MNFRIVLAARGSPLSRAQARLVAGALRRAARAAKLPTPRISFRWVASHGDKDRRGSLPGLAAAGPGLFARAVETEVLEGRADLAVHSLKDLPLADPKGLRIAALLVREDPRDAWVGTPPDALRLGATVGTSAPRRVALLHHYRPDLEAVAIRGNVATRIAKIGSGDDPAAPAAVLLAAAGLRRLGIRRAFTPLDLHAWPCAPGQGIVAIQARRDAPQPLRLLLSRVDDRASRRAAEAERSLLAALGGGCHLAVGAYAETQGTRMVLYIAADLRKQGRLRRAEVVARRGESPAALGRRAARAVR